MSVTVKPNTATKNTTVLVNRRIEWIVIHYTAGTSSKGGTANSLAEWYRDGANPANPASSDYIVDDENIIQYNPSIINRYTWCVGGAKYKAMSTTEGGKYYGICTNKNSISIEICSSKVNKGSLAAQDLDWYFTEPALSLAAGLVRLLMQKYNIDGGHVIMHHHVTGKLCPAMWCQDESKLEGWRNFQKMFGYSEKPESPKDVLYCVQVGAFASKENALNFLENVKKTYPAAFIKENGLYYVQVGAFKDSGNAEAYLKTVKTDYPNAFIKTM